MGKVFFVEQPEGGYEKESRTAVCWWWQFINQIWAVLVSALCKGQLITK